MSVRDVPAGEPGPVPYVSEVKAPDEGHSADVHLTNLGVAQVLFEARNRYFERLPVEGGIWFERVIPMIRELVIRYESETAQLAPLRCSVVVVGRSRRSLVMEESVTDLADPEHPRLVATARSVHVAVDTQAGGSAEVPASLVALIEQVQQHPVPEVTRA